MLDFDFYMNEAIKEALKSQSSHSYYGSIIVNLYSGKIVGRGSNMKLKNPILHSEIIAINNAIEQNQTIDWSQTILFTTAESCPMCQGAIIWAGISQQVYGTSIDFLIQNGHPQIVIPSHYLIEKTPFYQGTVQGGVLSEKTNQLYINNGTISESHSNK